MCFAQKINILSCFSPNVINNSLMFNYIFCSVTTRTWFYRWIVYNSSLITTICLSLKSQNKYPKEVLCRIGLRYLFCWLDTTDHYPIIRQYLVGHFKTSTFMKFRLTPDYFFWENIYNGLFLSYLYNLEYQNVRNK